MRLINPGRVTAPYRIGWWTHAWWPTRPLLIGLLTGNQPSPRAGNGQRFVGRRWFVKPIMSRLRKIRRPHRPWQSEAPTQATQFARRALTAAGAERKMLTDVEHAALHGEPSPYQARRTRRRKP